MRWEIKRQVDDLRKHGQVKGSNSSWHSPVVLVKKAYPEEYRFAVDY